MSSRVLKKLVQIKDTPIEDDLESDSDLVVPTTAVKQLNINRYDLVSKYLMKNLNLKNYRFSCDVVL